MSCPNCGAKLEHPTQRFCQDCGTKLPDLSDSSELAQKLSVSQDSRDNYQLQQKSVKISSPRPLSKTSLGLGIVSVIIAVTTFNLGTSFFIEPYLFPLSINQVLLIFFGILNIIGTVFGIISKIFNIQAQKNESLNAAISCAILLYSSI